MIRVNCSLTLLVLLLSVRAHAGPTTCDDVADHLMELKSADLDPSLWDSFRADTRSFCEENYSDEVRACKATASDYDVYRACESAQSPATHQDLPAISSDGTIVALPFIDVWTSLDQVEVRTIWSVRYVAVGEVSGDDEQLIQDDQAIDEEHDLDDNSAEVDERLRASGFSAVHANSLEYNGVTIKVSGSARKRKVVFRAGKKVVARATIKAPPYESVRMLGFFVVRGRPSWIYLSYIEDEGGGVERIVWRAIKAKL